MIYDRDPSYRPAAGRVGAGWDEAVTTLPAQPLVLALDGPAHLDWEGAVARLGKALADAGVDVGLLDLRDHLLPWDEIVRLTESAVLNDDPDFTTICDLPLAELVRLPDVQAPTDGVTVVYGPGAALVAHDVLWYADLPKRYAEAAAYAGTARNLGQRSGAGTTKRMFFVDWPVQDRHRDSFAGEIDCWLDLQTGSDDPAWIDGTSMRASFGDLSGRPFRVRPFFNSTPWGGHWAQRELGFNPEAVNTALGYELIAPENGVLLGDRDGPQVEVPFQLMIAAQPERVLGERVQAEFGTSFPIRFDYLDTIDGGHLSVHCHPQPDYMRQVFGLPYTQHESYYVVIDTPGSGVFLGLRGDVDVEEFHREAVAAFYDGTPFDVADHVQNHPADRHQLFWIPAGTPHASGVGNLVLEISATPYLYSLRFYDWLRKDSAGRQRPVHVEHAFANLDTSRRGDDVHEDLIPEPTVLREGDGWREERLGDRPEIFYEVRRIVLAGDKPAPDDTGDRFHVLNVVEGEGVLIRTASGHEHPLAFAETLVVPAATGPYTLHRLGGSDVRVVKSLVR